MFKGVAVVIFPYAKMQIVVSCIMVS